MPLRPPPTCSASDAADLYFRQSDARTHQGVAAPYRPGKTAVLLIVRGHRPLSIENGSDDAERDRCFRPSIPRKFIDTSHVSPSVGVRWQPGPPTVCGRRPHTPSGPPHRLRSGKGTTEVNRSCPGTGPPRLRDFDRPPPECDRLPRSFESPASGPHVAIFRPVCQPGGP